MICVTCPSCHSVLVVKDKFGGQEVYCLNPECYNEIGVPPKTKDQEKNTPHFTVFNWVGNDPRHAFSSVSH